jgi:hypothetical protein
VGGGGRIPGGLDDEFNDIDTSLDVEDPFPRDDSAPARPEDVTGMSGGETLSPLEGLRLGSYSVDGFSPVYMPQFMSPITRPVEDEELYWHCHDSTEDGTGGEVDSIVLEPPTLSDMPIPNADFWRPEEVRRGDEA